MKLVPQSLFRLIRMSRLLCLIALAIALDGDGIKFGLGDDGNLSVEVDAKIKMLQFVWKFGHFRSKISNFGRKSARFGFNFKVTYSPVITTSGDWTQIFAIFILFFWKLDFWLFLRTGSLINCHLRFENDEIWINQNHKYIHNDINSTEIKNWLRTLVFTIRVLPTLTLFHGLSRPWTVPDSQILGKTSQCWRQNLSDR